MARAKNIKPAFFTNDTLAECQPLARLLFVGLWTLADREGRLYDRPKKIKAELLPYDDVDCDILLLELYDHGFIIRYRNNDIACIQVVNFLKHQNPHMKEGASTIPAPDLHHKSRENTETSPADSLNLITHSHPSVEVVKQKHFYPESFEELWSIWPRREGKREALKAYQSATKRGTHDVIINGCNTIASTHRDCATPDRFIPHLATWLNRDGWLDDPAAIERRNDPASNTSNQRRGMGATAMVAGHHVLQDIVEDKPRF